MTKPKYKCPCCQWTGTNPTPCETLEETKTGFRRIPEGGIMCPRCTTPLHRADDVVKP